MSTVFPAPRPTLIPIHGSDSLFPVRRIYCVGRNYAAHAREMGKNPDRDPPFFFTKWADTSHPHDLVDRGSYFLPVPDVPTVARRSDLHRYA